MTPLLTLLVVWIAVVTFGALLSSALPRISRGRVTLSGVIVAGLVATCLWAGTAALVKYRTHVGSGVIVVGSHLPNRDGDIGEEYEVEVSERQYKRHQLVSGTLALLLGVFLSGIVISSAKHHRPSEG